MSFFIILATVFIPTVMLFLQSKSMKFRFFFNVAAVVATIIFGCIAATSIYQVIADDAVFMTTIHAIFLNPFFLITGAYLGVFLIYRLLLLAMHER